MGQLSRPLLGLLALAIAVLAVVFLVSQLGGRQEPPALPAERAPATTTKRESPLTTVVEEEATGAVTLKYVKVYHTISENSS